jgi:hypothetical protein
VDQTRQETQSRNRAGWAPWGTRPRMKILALFGLPLAVLLLAVGIFMTAKHGDGVPAMVVGGVLLAFWMVALPMARQRQKSNFRRA